MTRRQVRVTPSFFDRLDELLPEERTADGRPSATDFLLHEMPSIIEFLAVDYETSTFAFTEVPGVRLLVSSGRLVRAIATYVRLAHDDSVEVIYLEIDES